MIKILLMSVVSLTVMFSCSKEETIAVLDEPLDVSCKPESSLLSPGIIGGKRVTRGDKDDSTVALILFKVGKNRTGYCTGAMISPTVMLTAAHCMQAAAKDTKVIFYTSVSCESDYNPAKNAQSVDKIIIHDDYLPLESAALESKNDIAILVLKDPAPARYPIYKIAKPTEIANSKLFFYGYGVTGSNQAGMGILRKTSFAEEDFEILVATKKVKVTQNGGRGICSGDSGGPGLVNVGSESKILGINSFVMGPENNTCNGSATLALAYSYEAWIQNILDQNK